MKKLTLIATAFYHLAFAQQPKIVSDCTITYSVSSSNASKQSTLGSKTIYVKGKDIRIDLVSNMFNQTIFYNNNSGNATILKTVGQSKYISSYTADEWKKQNELNGGSVSFTGNSKTILNYECRQAVLKLNNGNSYTIYYTPSIIPSVIENPFEFKDIPGLVLEYESLIKGNDKVVFTAEKIDFSPVPSLLFEIPKTGYRVLH